jgi:hypothetical protein
VMRLIVAFASGSSDALVMGDDSLEVVDDPAAHRARLDLMGYQVREYESQALRSMRSFVFCSHKFGPEGSLGLVTWRRALYAFGTRARDPARDMAVLTELSQSPAGPWLRDFVSGHPAGLKQLQDVHRQFLPFRE